MGRAALWGLGIVLLLAGALCGLFALFGIAAAEPPDVLEDPSETWTEVAARSGLAVLVAALTGWLLAVGGVLIARAARARERRSVLWVLPAVFACVWAVAIGALLAPNLGQAVMFPDCDDFTFDSAAWAGDGVEHDRVAAGLSHCGTLRGWSRSRVVRTLGPPFAAVPDAYMYDGLVVYLDRKRVTRAFADGDTRADSGPSD